MKTMTAALAVSAAIGMTACLDGRSGFWSRFDGDGDGHGQGHGGHCRRGSKHCGPHDAGHDASSDAGAVGDAFSLRVVARGLYAPWEITWGPDDQLWLTERVGHRVSRVDPSTGALSTLAWIPDAYTTSQHEGVLGMALHPELLTGTGNDFVFVAYTYDADPGEPLERRAKISRYRYDSATWSLVEPSDVITGLPANNDHNGGRLKIAPDGKLHYTVGDQGANQFGNKCNPNLAQVLPTPEQVLAADWSSYAGKTLRLELDGGIPADNPVLEGVRSHVFTYGHRNPQGIVFGPDGTLYESEQGPKTDDEVNVLVAGKNYGWPHVAGYRDDQAYEYGNWSAAPDCEELEFSDYELPPSVPRTAESAWSHPDFVPPIATFFTVASDYEFRDPACEGAEFVCWPTIAPPSIDIYTSDAIPAWSGSLLVPSLKEGSVYVVPLDGPGASGATEPVPTLKTTNRYRDVAISPDGRTLYVITDNEGLTQAPGGGYTAQLDHPGSVLAFSAQP